MKKYTSGAFQATTYGIYKSAQDTITSFPASIITNGGNITPWTIYGNTSAGQSVGEKTANLFDKNATDTTNGYIDNYYLLSTGATTANSQLAVSEYIPVNPSETYTISFSRDIGNSPALCLYDIDKIYIDGQSYSGNTTITLTTTAETAYIRVSINKGYVNNYMLNTGGTSLPFEPYGYKLPVVIGSTTTNIYMADVLRMSSGADPVYDIMSSTGVITRNVDTDGSPLPTPTTESFTAPTLATVAGSQSFNIDTTVKPSSVSLTYTGWHTHSDKQYSGGQWGQVTSNAKVLRRKKSAKSKT